MIKSLIKFEIKLFSIIFLSQLMGIFAIDLVNPRHGEALVWSMGCVSGLALLHPFTKDMFTDLFEFVDKLINHFLKK